MEDSELFQIFWKNYDQKREFFGYSSTQICDKLGISKSYLSSMRVRGYLPAVPHIVAITKLFNSTLDHMLLDAPETKSDVLSIFEERVIKRMRLENSFLTLQRYFIDESAENIDKEIGRLKKG